MNHEPSFRPSSQYIFEKQPDSENESSNIVVFATQADIQTAVEIARQNRELTNPDPEQLDQALSTGVNIQKLPAQAIQALVRARFESERDFFHGAREEQAILGKEMNEFAEDAFRHIDRYKTGAYRFVDAFLQIHGNTPGRIIESGPGPGIFTHFIAKALQKCRIEAFDISPTSVDEFRKHQPDYTNPANPNTKRYGEQYTKAAIEYHRKRGLPYLDVTSNNVTVAQADFFAIAKHVESGELQPYDAHIGRHWGHRPEPEQLEQTLRAMISVVKRDGGLVYQTLFTKIETDPNLADGAGNHKVREFLTQSASKRHLPNLRASFDAAKFNAPSEADLIRAFEKIITTGEFDFSLGSDGLPRTHLVLDDGIGSARVVFVRKSGENLAGSARYGANA